MSDNTIEFGRLNFSVHSQKASVETLFDPVARTVIFSTGDRVTTRSLPLDTTNVRPQGNGTLFTDAFSNEVWQTPLRHADVINLFGRIKETHPKPQ
jgi:hypothetical protein